MIVGKMSVSEVIVYYTRKHVILRIITIMHLNTDRQFTGLLILNVDGCVFSHSSRNINENSSDRISF